MQKTILLNGKLCSTNTLYRFSRYGMYMTKNGQETKTSYQKQASAQWREKPIEHDHIELVINLFFNDKRRRDWDNYHKISGDALNGIVYKDDCQIHKATVTKNYTSGEPCIIIDIIF